ncbi:MAG TPA: SET domain-containing protein-lysine N-methyltransferase [Pseudonocardiaceae bacterium]|nr:SET domain-containing protein-lysine N-methyltransferase [Pseudonocardiaceae bacterium]
MGTSKTRTRRPRAAGAQGWLHPAVRVQYSPISGRGLFTGEAIAAGAVVATLAGRLVDGAELTRLLIAASHEHRYLDTIGVDNDLHLILPPNQPIHYGNHSCDPTLWHDGAYTLVARRDLEPDTELTVDYATQTVEPDFRMPCNCRAPGCRGVVTGTDWQLPGWALRYRGHVVPPVAARLNER